MPELQILKSESNIIWINEFSEESAKAFCQKVIQISNEDPNVPVVAYIDSYGGYVDALAAMISAIDSVPNTFITVAVGKAMSCGAMLLSHGDYRYVGPAARVMIHEISSGAIGHISDLKVSTQESERLNQQWMNWLAGNCKIPGGYAGLKEKMKGLLPPDGRDLYLTPEDSIRFGIADGIGIPKVLTQRQYEIVTVPEMASRTQALQPKGKKTKKPAKKVKKGKS